MNIEVVGARDLSAKDQAIWSSFHEGNPELQSPFFSPLFTSFVARVRDDVKVGIISESGSPVAFFPFQLGSFGVGRPVGGGLSDYHGVISEPGFSIDPIDLISRCGLSVWDFDHLPATQQGFSFHAGSQAHSPYMDLTEGYEDYCLKVREGGSKQVNKIGTLRRKLEREKGPLDFSMHSTDQAFLQEMMRWKSEQYGEAGTVNPFNYPWTKKLLETIHATREKEFSGVLSVLYAQGKPISIHFGMRSRTILHYWFPVYSQEYYKYSPGLVLLLMMAEAAESEGIRMIDMGKGNSLYKQRLKSGEIDLLEGTVGTNSIAMGMRKFWQVGGRCLTCVPIPKVAAIPGRIRVRFSQWKRFR